MKEETRTALKDTLGLSSVFMTLLIVFNIVHPLPLGYNIEAALALLWLATMLFPAVRAWTKLNLRISRMEDLLRDKGYVTASPQVAPSTSLRAAGVIAVVSILLGVVLLVCVSNSHRENHERERQAIEERDR